MKITKQFEAFTPDEISQLHEFIGSYIESTKKSKSDFEKKSKFLENLIDAVSILQDDTTKITFIDPEGGEELEKSKELKKIRQETCKKYEDELNIWEPIFAKLSYLKEIIS